MRKRHVEVAQSVLPPPSGEGVSWALGGGEGSRMCVQEHHDSASLFCTALLQVGVVVGVDWEPC